MARWSEFEADAPELAAGGRRLLYARGAGEALLVTVRGDDLPRVHPVNVGVVDGGLYVFLLPSAKRSDLEQDGRYALHAHQDPAAPDEFSVRGRAAVVADRALRARVADAWPFEVDDAYVLVELSVAQAILGLRGADEWPPRYRRGPILTAAIISWISARRAPADRCYVPCPTPDSRPPPGGEREQFMAAPEPLCPGSARRGSATWRRVDEATPASPCCNGGPHRVARQHDRQCRRRIVRFARGRDDRHHRQ